MDCNEDGILCGSVGSEGKLPQVQAGWDAIFDVLDQFPNFFHMDTLQLVICIDFDF